MALSSLTERQREVYLFIEDKILNRGYGPTVREICEEFDIKSPNGVVCHLKALEKKGLIRRTPKQSRAIELLDPGKNSNGNGLASGSLDSSEFKALLDVADRHVIQVADNSLEKFHIVNGDYVIIQPTDGPSSSGVSSGSVALIKSANGETFLRYFENGMTGSGEVVGVVAGVIRSIAEA